MATSYNGWTASKSPASIDIDPDFTAAGRKFPGGVKRGPVSVVLRYMIEQFDKRVEEVDLYDPGDEWGYTYKPSANSPSKLSCHSSGTAVDINATRHPNRKRGTFTPKQVDAIHAILAELDGVVRWLGDTSGTPDEMHFEIKGTAAEVARVAGRLLTTDPLAPQEDDMPLTEEDKKWILSALKSEGISGAADANASTVDDLVVQHLEPRLKAIEDRLAGGGTSAKDIAAELIKQLG